MAKTVTRRNAGPVSGEVAEAFEEMGLETEEKRQKVLSQGKEKKSDSPADRTRYITRLSNSTKAAPSA